MSINSIPHESGHCTFLISAYGARVQTASYVPSSMGGHSSEEPVGSVENESPDRLGGVFILELGSIPRGGAEAVISETPARSSASAKSVILAKRFWGSLASALLTTCSTGAGVVVISSRRGWGGSERCCIATSSAEEPWKGHLPQSHSYTTMANAY